MLKYFHNQSRHQIFRKYCSRLWNLQISSLAYLWSNLFVLNFRGHLIIYLISSLHNFHNRKINFWYNKLYPSRTTPWKLSKDGVFSGPYFPVFGLNTGKWGPEKTLYSDTFRSDYFLVQEKRPFCVKLVV